MQSFSQFTTQLDEATSDKPSLLRSAVDRLTGKKRKERLDRASKILINLRDSGKLDKKIPYELGDGRGNKIKLATANVRMKSLAGSLGRNKKKIDSAAERIAKEYNERTGKNVSVADVRKVIVRKAVSKATNRMKTRAARARLNENLKRLDEVIDFTAGLGPVVGSIIQTVGQVGMDMVGQSLAARRQNKQLRKQKRQDLMKRQQATDMAMGGSPTTGMSSKIKINTNPRATVAQLRGTGGTQLGGSSIGKQFAAMY